MSSKETAGLGVVVRDSLWFVLLAAVKPVVGDFSPEVAESMAVFFGLQVAMESEFKDLEVETDAANIGSLIQEIQSFVSDQSLVYSFMHVRRSANRVAHQLAKLAISVNQHIVWLEDYPSCVGSYVASDFPCNLQLVLLAYAISSFKKKKKTL
ncbi:hypothetical protein ACOSQ2_009373 [Xanthoceras sorbifolium]